MNHKKYFIYTLILFVQQLSFGQSNSMCILKHQLKRMQAIDVKETNIFLWQESWSRETKEIDDSIKIFQYPLFTKVNTWTKNDYSAEQIYIFSLKNKSNIVLYETNENCFSNLLSTFQKQSFTPDILDEAISFQEGQLTYSFRQFKDAYSYRNIYQIIVYNTRTINNELKSIEQVKILERLLMERKQAKYDSLIKLGDRLFSVSQFESAYVQYKAASLIFNDDDLEQKINLSKQNSCEQKITIGDSLVTEKKYEEALVQFNSARACGYNDYLIQTKIQNVEKLITEEKIRPLISEGDNYFRLKKLDLALNKYRSILALDKSNRYAAMMIPRIEEMKKVLDERKISIYAYRDTNPDDYFNFKRLILKNINERIDNLDNGNLYLNYNIKFDTLGRNRSELQTFTGTLPGNSSEFLKNINTIKLNPSLDHDFYVNSFEKLSIDLNWSTKQFKVIAKESANELHIIQKPDINQYSDTFRNFIRQQSNTNGTFIFKVKDKVTEQQHFTDISLHKYHVPGPECALLSMIMPGLGTLKVSQGKKGGGKLAWFIITTGLAVAAKQYSNSQYKAYLDATDQTAMDKYFKMADLSNKISLASAGISATIYLYDILWVLARGASNISKSKNLKIRLNEGGPIFLQTQPINPL